MSDEHEQSDASTHEEASEASIMPAELERKDTQTCSSPTTACGASRPELLVQVNSENVNNNSDASSVTSRNESNSPPLDREGSRSTITNTIQQASDAPTSSSIVITVQQPNISNEEQQQQLRHSSDTSNLPTISKEKSIDELLGTGGNSVNNNDLAINMPSIATTPAVPTPGNVVQELVLPSEMLERMQRWNELASRHRLKKRRKELDPQRYIISRVTSSHHRVKKLVKRAKEYCVGKPHGRVYEVQNHEDLASVRSVIIDLVYALLCFGMPAYRVDYHVSLISTSYGESCMVDITGTGFLITFASTYNDRNADTRFIKLKSSAWNLSKLSQLDDLADDIASNKVSIGDAQQRIKDIIAQPPLYAHTIYTLFAYAVCGVMFAMFINCTWPELIASFTCGGVVGLMTILVPRYTPSLTPIVHSICTIACSLVAIAFKAVYATRRIPLQTLNVDLSASLLLLPGLSLTISIGELARRHIRAGLIRFITAIIAAVQIGAVLYVMSSIESAMKIPEPTYTPFVYPYWALAIVLPCASITFIIALKAPKNWLVTVFIIANSYVAFFVTRLVTKALRPELGALIGAIGVQTVSLLYGWISRHHPITVTVCVILLQVPGSLSVKSFKFLIDKDVYDGATLLVQALGTGLAIAVGLLLGDFLIPLHHKREPILSKKLIRKWFPHLKKKEKMNELTTVANIPRSVSNENQLPDTSQVAIKVE